MEAGVYKDVTGSYGYLNVASNYIPKISRKKARELAIEEGCSTTLKGTYTKPKEVEVTRPKRAYRKLNLGAKREPNEIIIEVEKKDHYNTYQACLMFAKKHYDFKYTYERTETGNTIFRRA